MLIVSYSIVFCCRYVWTFLAT